jgi:LacI family transcriptional regulator
MVITVAKAVNIKAIAEVAGVSAATVSRVLNKNCAVNEKTRNKVLKISRQFNYRSDAVKTGMLENGSKLIGLVLPELVDEFYDNIIRGIDNEVQGRGHRLLVNSFHCNITTLKNSLQLLENCHVDGIILVAPHLSMDLNKVLPDISVPVVTISTRENSNAEAAFKLNNYQGVYAIMDHFINFHNYKKIGMIKGPCGNIDAEERHMAFLDIMQKKGLEINQEMVLEGDFRLESGYYAFSRMLSSMERPEAVFIANDMMAIGAYEAARRHNVEIGKDIAVAGFDDIYMARLMKPALTSVHVPSEELGMKAFRRLIGCLDGSIKKSGKEMEEVSAGLIMRESCGCRGEFSIV